MKNKIVLFTSKDSEISLDVQVEDETVWLTQAQMTKLFGVDRTVITRHINNIFKEGELEKKSNVQLLHIANSDRPVQYYNLDVIISVGYRVKSKRGVEFRKWANTVLRQYILEGYAVNEKRLKILERTVSIQSRMLANSIDASGDDILKAVSQYEKALELLDNYDHHTLQKPPICCTS